MCIRDSLRNVRYYGHNAYGILGIRLWFQKSLDSLVMAGVQPDIPNGLLIRVAAPFERSHPVSYTHLLYAVHFMPNKRILKE